MRILLTLISTKWCLHVITKISFKRVRVIETSLFWNNFFTLVIGIKLASNGHSQLEKCKNLYNLATMNLSRSYVWIFFLKIEILKFNHSDKSAWKVTQLCTFAQKD